MNPVEISLVEASDLALNFKSHRLVEFGLTARSSESEIIAVLWEAMDVRELTLSIAASGFFSHEPLIVEREGQRNVVIEGNRRLAAVKILLDPDLAGELNPTVPAISQSAKDALKTVPCLRSTREKAWRYVGFKHVNGPAKWSGYAKAQYIAYVNRNFEASLKDIARQIGDTHGTVEQLYRGLKVLEQAERIGVFNRENRWYRHFSFSHLCAALDCPGISAYIGLRPASDENPDPVPPEREEELQQLFLWLYGSRLEGVRPVIQLHNPHLGQLDAVLGDRSATAELRRNSDLAQAFETSRPARNRFEESLLAAKEHLRKARGILSEGYDGSEELLQVAETAANLADGLYDEAARKRNSRRKSLIAEEA